MVTSALERPEGRLSLDRGAAARWTIVGAGVLLVVAFVASLAIGPTGISLSALPDAAWHWLGLTSDADAGRHRLVLIDLRLPRTLMAAFVGAALAVSGALLQGLFRNPLADPSLLGISNGAALAAITVIAFGKTFAAPWTSAFGVYALPFAAFAGALATILVLMTIASRRGTLAIGTLILAGIAMAAICGALMGFISYSSDDRELRDITLWSLGSLAGANWPKLMAITPFAIAAALILPRLSRAMNGFLLGEAEAFHLGVDTERVKRLVVFATAAAVGAAVAVAGVIGFVGLIVPHVVRLLAGPDHRVVLPASVLGGAALMIVADIASRMIVMPAELPIGIMMAAIGGPIFLHLIIKRGIGGME